MLNDRALLKVKLKHSDCLQPFVCIFRLLLHRNSDCLLWWFISLLERVSTVTPKKESFHHYFI